MAEYEIGGICCTMSPKQADRWNAGDVTAKTMAGAIIHIPGRWGARSYVRDGEVIVNDGMPTIRLMDFWTAIVDKSGADTDLYREYMDGMPANPVGKGD